jgi:hypothetical protein
LIARHVGDVRDRFLFFHGSDPMVPKAGKFLSAKVVSARANGRKGGRSKKKKAA